MLYLSCRMNQVTIKETEFCLWLVCRNQICCAEIGLCSTLCYSQLRSLSQGEAGKPLRTAHSVRSQLMCEANFSTAYKTELTDCLFHAARLVWSWASVIQLRQVV